MKPSKAFLIMLGVVALFILLSGTIYYFGENMLANSAAEVAKLEAQNNALENKANIYADSRQKVDFYSNIDTLSKEVIPESKSQSELVSELKKFGDSLGITISNVSFGGDVKLGEDQNTSQTTTVDGISGVRVQELNVAFTGSVPFESAIAYLQRIESNKRILQVRSVNLAPDTEDPSKITGFSIQLVAYSRG